MRTDRSLLYMGSLSGEGGSVQTSYASGKYDHSLYLNVRTQHQLKMKGYFSRATSRIDFCHHRKFVRFSLRALLVSGFRPICVGCTCGNPYGLNIHCLLFIVKILWFGKKFLYTWRLVPEIGASNSTWQTLSSSQWFWTWSCSVMISTELLLHELISFIRLPRTGNGWYDAE